MGGSWHRDVNGVPVVFFFLEFVVPTHFDGEPRSHRERCPHFEIILVTWRSKRPFSSAPGVYLLFFIIMSVQAVSWRTSCELPVWLTRELIVLGTFLPVRLIFSTHTRLLQLHLVLAYILMHLFRKITDVVLELHFALEELCNTVALTNR